VFGSLGLARLYIFSGQPDKALNILEDTLTWYGGDNEFSLFTGLAYAFKKDTQLAIEAFKNALKLNPSSSLAHFYLGVQIQNSDPSSSRRHLKAFLKLTKDQPRQDNMIEKAEKLLKKL